MERDVHVSEQSPRGATQKREKNGKENLEEEQEAPINQDAQGEARTRPIVESTHVPVSEGTFQTAVRIAMGPGAASRIGAALVV